MTLYYSLVFVLLIAESIAFLFLILPFPYSWRRAMLRWISQSQLVTQSQYVLKFAFIFVFILFLDATNRTYNVQSETKDDHIIDARSEATIHAKKFYNQRNMYLTGFTLFLSLILNRTYVLIVDLLKSEDQLEAKALEKKVETLTSELNEEKKKSRDFDNLKKQASQQNDEYVRLSDSYNKLLGKQENREDDKKND
ncbi:B-cell receptor-associated protein 31-like-domain-containing protein [Gigaspora rosea]|uniref:Endoplasmic reticulum transmembrane protein n=1 Tax=Gigaspora rosea TaxID=44941 RepID=A0A397VA38_9GLOM|nr:B-cell receptor-associated protein 31-like-domain-containing protein [Gigaspora rosea]